MSTLPEEGQRDAYLGRIARGAGISLFGQGFGRALAYVTQVLLARMYGPTQLGFYVLGVTIVGFLSTVARFGMNTTVVRGVAGYQAEGDIGRTRGIILLTVWMSFALSLALSILMFLGAGFLANKVFNEPSLETVFEVFALSVPFFTLMDMTLWATEGFQTVKYSTAAKQILQPLINLVFIVVFYLVGSQVLGAVAAYILSMVAGSALALYYLRRLFPRLLDRNTPPIFETRTALSASSNQWVSQLAEYANLWTPVVALGIFASGEEVGIYNAAGRTAMLAGIVFMGFAGIFSPMISNLYRRGLLQDLSYLFSDVSRWTFTAGLVVFWLTALLSRDILAVFGDEFVSGWIVMVIIAASQLFALSTGATNRVLVMTEHQKVFMLANISAAVTGFVGVFALVPIYGMLGAALVDAGTTVLVHVITLTVVRRALNLWPYSQHYLKPFIAGLLAASVTLLARTFLSLSTGLSAMLVLAPLFVVIFAAILLGLGLSPSDRQFFAAIRTAVRRTA